MMVSLTDAGATRRAHAVTVNQVFLGDTILNWFLGGALTFFPGFVDRTLRKAGSPQMLPNLLYMAIGLGFLGYSAWQTLVLARQRMGAPALVFAALMALVPFVALTLALAVLSLPLKQGWRVVLWVGNTYMGLLGLWYLVLEAAMRREGLGGEL